MYQLHVLHQTLSLATDVYNIGWLFPSGYYAPFIHTIQALSNPYLISHIDTFHTPYRVFRDQFPRLAVVYTKHPSIIQPTEKPSKEPDKNVSVGSDLFFFSPRRWIRSQINALRHHTPAEPWNSRKFRVRSTRGRNQNSTFNNGYPRPVPGYINHGTIRKRSKSPPFFFLSCSPSGVHCNVVPIYVYIGCMCKLMFSSAPPCSMVSRSTVLLDVKRRSGGVVAVVGQCGYRTHKEVELCGSVLVFSGYNRLSLYLLGN